MSEPLHIEISLGPNQVEAIAQRVAEIIETGRRPMTASPYLTIPETAELLRCDRARVDNLLSQGRLARVKDGRRTLIARTELEAHLAGESHRSSNAQSRLGR